MTFYRTVPTYTQPLTSGKNTSAAWYRWFQTHDKGFPPSNETVINEHMSPFTYQAPRAGAVIVSGGTVSLIEVSRTSGKFYTTGRTAGQFSMSASDQLRITFGVKPTLVFFPS
jgi:hypothetical protein